MSIALIAAVCIDNIYFQYAVCNNKNNRKLCSECYIYLPLFIYSSDTICLCTFLEIQYVFAVPSDCHADEGVFCEGHARLLSVSEETILSSGMPSRIAIPVSLAGHHIAAAQAAAAQASAQAQAAALEQLREKLESGEPPEKKVMLMAEEQQRFMQHALQQNLLAMASQLPMNITINNRGR